MSAGMIKGVLLTVVCITGALLFAVNIQVEDTIAAAVTAPPTTIDAAVTAPPTTIAAAVTAAPTAIAAACRRRDVMTDSEIVWHYDNVSRGWSLSDRDDGGRIETNVRDARRCLAQRSPRGVLFMGDSVTRYQYLNLVYFLETGNPPPTEAQNENEKLHRGWPEFYSLTNSRLGGHEQCDCFRAGANISWSLENRYYHNAIHGVTVAYVQLFGEQYPIRRHRTDATGKLHCSPGQCSADDRYLNRYPPDMLQTVEQIIQEIGPSDVLLNIGIHHYQANRPFSVEPNARLLKAMAKRLKNSTRMHWKATTGIPKAFEEMEHDFEKLLLADGDFAGTYDTFGLTAGMMNEVQRLNLPTAEVMWDGLHYQPAANVALNQALLAYLCRSDC